MHNSVTSVSVSAITYTVIHFIGQLYPLKNITIEVYSVNRHRGTSVVHSFEITWSFKGVSLHYIINLSHQVITFRTLTVYFNLLLFTVNWEHQFLFYPAYIGTDCSPYCVRHITFVHRARIIIERDNCHIQNANKTDAFLSWNHLCYSTFVLRSF